MVRTASVSATRLAHIRSLLVAAFRHDVHGEFTTEDWNHTLGGWHAIVSIDERIVSHAAVVPRRIWSADRWFECGYVEAVATSAEARHRGYASIAVTAINEIIRDRYELGALSTGTQSLYERLGWEPWRGTTSVVRADRLERTPDDDDSIMVLRCGPSAALPLDGEIRCESRPGDDW